MRIQSSMGLRPTMAGNPVPIGSYIQYFINAPAPNGCIPCNGQAVSRTVYPELFIKFGTYFGAGDGSTTFNLPDFNTGAVDTITYVKALDVVTGFVTDANTLGGQQPDFYTGKTMKNKIINGNFDVWQRSTSSTLYAYSTVDRWSVDSAGSYTYATSQKTFTPGQGIVPNEPTYYLQTQHTPVSSAATDVSLLAQKIEDVRTLAGKTVTLSFWASTNIAGAIKVSLGQVFGSGGSTTVWLPAQPINLTTNWAKYTCQFSVPSIAGKTVGSYSFLELCFWTNSGSTASTTYNLGGAFVFGSQLNLSQVQLEEGSVATPFEQRHFQQELALCQRYYEKSYSQGTNPGSVTNFGKVIQYYFGTNATVPPRFMFNIPFKVEKRLAPTVIMYSSSTGTANKISQDDGSDIATYSVVTGTSSMSIDATNSSTSRCGVFAHWTADAEL